MELVNTLKNYIKNIIDTTRFTEIYVGNVINTMPLKVKINEKLILTSTQIIITKTAKDKIVKGINLLIIGESGGQKFYAVDEVI